MSKDSIFSTYKTGENRVTASILAVLRNLSLNRLERILGSLMEESSFELVKFTNQDASSGAGVLDASISASVDILVETKIVKDSLSIDQLDRHLNKLKERKKNGYKSSYLLVMTPDDERPHQIDKYVKEPIIWKSFVDFNQAIDDILDDSSEVISERETFLLRELQIMFEKETLLGSPYDTVIVAARYAWPEYENLGAYICQSNRSFQNIKRIGFYCDGKIQPYFPRILDVIEEVTLEENSPVAEFREIINNVLKETPRNSGDQCKIFKLSKPDSDLTIKLGNAIDNDQMSKTGKRTAYTMGQRYVNLTDLTGIMRTSEIKTKSDKSNS